MSIVIGLTGQTGAGKSSVSGILKELGYDIIDADVVAREVVGNGKKCLMDLALEFSIDILNGDGTLNRRKLGSMVFNDKYKLKRLNEITFPFIIEEIYNEIHYMKNTAKKGIVLDAPTLFESGANRFCDKIISVIAPSSVRLNRIVHRDKIEYKEAQDRIDSQQKDDYYITRSDFVIKNKGDLTDLRLSTLEVMEGLS